MNSQTAKPKYRTVAVYGSPNFADALERFDLKVNAAMEDGYLLHGTLQHNLIPGSGHTIIQGMELTIPRN